MPARTAKCRPAWKPTTEEIDKLATLAKLGATVSVADAAKILDVPEDRLAHWLTTNAGRHLWAKSRAEGRAELVAQIRRLALEGNPQAQKMLAGLIAADDTRAARDQRFSVGDTRELLGRSAETIVRRRRQGDWISAGADGRYGLSEIIGLIPRLWDRLEITRATVARLEKTTGQAQADRAEAERQLKLEQLRREKRENEIAEGRLVDVAEIRRVNDELCTHLRQTVIDLANAIILKTAAPDHAAKLIRAEAKAALQRVARTMQRTANG